MNWTVLREDQTGLEVPLHMHLELAHAYRNENGHMSVLSLCCPDLT